MVNATVLDKATDALERELSEFTGQTHWEREKVRAAAERIMRSVPGRCGDPTCPCNDGDLCNYETHIAGDGTVTEGWAPRE